ncbi:MAG: protein-glutamate O-methyltransferase CheR [Polyangiales bacterium]
MSLGELDSQTFGSLAQLAHRLTGIHLDERKQGMLLSRIRREARALGHSTYQEYLGSIQGASHGSPDVDSFVDAITTNKTSFFRTLSVWRYLIQEHLPKRTSTRRPMRWWSGASSTGEEAASIAMLCETFRQSDPSFRYEVFASDISTAMVKVAEAQSFDNAWIARSRVPESIKIDDFFDVDGERSVLRPALRKNLSFAQHNLLAPIGRGRFDVACVRNVIIYFTKEDQRKVLDHAIEALVPDGLLITGDSESPLQLTNRLKFIAPCLFRRVR